MNTWTIAHPEYGPCDAFATDGGCWRCGEVLTALQQRYVALHGAALQLYEAGRWSCDRPVDEAALWEALRDALALPPGHATALGVGA